MLRNSDRIPQFKNSIKQLKEDIKTYRKNLNDADEVASDYAKDIVKIARRIEYASIYPPSALNEMQKATDHRSFGYCSCPKTLTLWHQVLRVWTVE